MIVFVLVFLALSFLPNFLNAAITCPSYPIGLGGTADSVDYQALDVTSTGDKVVVGGECRDSNICPGGSNPDPIIELVDTATRDFLWTYQITGSSYRSVLNIKFSPDASKIGAVLNLDDTTGLTLLMLTASNGNLLYAVRNTTMRMNNKHTLFSRSLLVENDGTVLMTLFYDWRMNMFKLAP